MKWLLLILLIVLFLILLVIVTKLTVILYVNHSQDDDHIKITFRAWFGLIRYTIDIPLVEVDKESPGIVLKHQGKTGGKKKSKEKKKKFSPREILTSMKDTRKIIEHVIGMQRIVKSFLRSITVKKFEWHTVLGVGDAAQTGILVGIGWSIKGVLLGMVSHYMKVKVQPEYSITPSFQQAISQTRLECMIQFRIGYAMLAGIRLLKHWRGGMPKMRSPILSKLPGTHNKKSI